MPIFSSIETVCNFLDRKVITKVTPCTGEWDLFEAIPVSVVKQRVSSPLLVG
ncbi:hypothetical protein [Xenorhabdus siamensis]|uniref:hypothetical protein n=1 Tax=Xenorhabdus siamensis TaxID=3136254 RepID=UPI0030F45D22